MRFYRNEPSNGITDAAKWVQRDPLSPQDAGIELIQDDTAFHAATVSMGTFGLVYSCVVEVMPFYYLTETRTFTTLDKAVVDYLLNDTKIQITRHVEFVVHPYPTVVSGGDVESSSRMMRPFAPLPSIDAANVSASYSKHYCLVTERNFASPASIEKHLALKACGKLPPPKPRNPIAAFFATTPLVSWVLAPIMRYVPSVTPWLLDQALVALEDAEYTAPYYEIFDLGVWKDAGFAAEVGLSVQNAATGAWDPSILIQAIDSILVNAQTVWQLGDQYQTSPFAVRFVKRSDALLSMMYDRDTAMIELDMIKPTYAGNEIMQRFERSMAQLGGRMHWGLSFDTLNGAGALARLGSDNMRRWVGAYKQFNARGTFDNVFTEHMGFRSIA